MSTLTTKLPSIFLTVALPIFIFFIFGKEVKAETSIYQSLADYADGSQQVNAQTGYSSLEFRVGMRSLKLYRLYLYYGTTPPDTIYLLDEQGGQYDEPSVISCTSGICIVTFNTKPLLEKNTNYNLLFDKTSGTWTPKYFDAIPLFPWKENQLVTFLSATFNGSITFQRWSVLTDMEFVLDEKPTDNFSSNGTVNLTSESTLDYYNFTAQLLIIFIALVAFFATSIIGIMIIK